MTTFSRAQSDEAKHSTANCRGRGTFRVERFVVAILAALVGIVANAPALAHFHPGVFGHTPQSKGRRAAVTAAPDLSISEFAFAPDNDRVIRVHIVNAGNIASGLCVLRLTVRKINGVPVGRVTEIKLPPLAPGKDKWLVLNAKSILPNNISLASTTFKLNADATSIVTESDEANNEVWHNL